MKKKLFTGMTICSLIIGIASYFTAIPMQSEVRASISEPALMFIFGAGLMGIAEYLKKQSGKQE